MFFSNNIKADGYDDCILKNMKNVDNDTAARAIIKACRGKHSNTSDSKDESDIIIYKCASGKLEFKFNKNDIKNTTYYKTKHTEFIWKKHDVRNFDDEQIILNWSNENYNRIRFNLLNNKITYFHTEKDKTQKTSCYKR